MKRGTKRAPVPQALTAQDRALLSEGVAALRLGLSKAQEDLLFDYAVLIHKWNRVFNLTALVQPVELITHHLLDSLAVLPMLAFELQNKPAPRILDVGAGAGLPGLVLAIAQPTWQLTLVDTVQKKASFMQQAIAQLGLTNARAVHARVESMTDDQGYDLITSRAFSSMVQFIELSSSLIRQDGVFAALKGRLEVDNTVPQGWRVDALHPIEVPFLNEERHLFMIKR